MASTISGKIRDGSPLAWASPDGLPDRGEFDCVHHDEDRPDGQSPAGQEHVSAGDQGVAGRDEENRDPAT